MHDATLTEWRGRIEELAVPGGDYYLICARRGDHPVPTRGLRFESRATARAARYATEQYRQALRRYDPELPRFDIAVAQTPRPDEEPASWERDRELFCHRVAAAVFESLAAGGHDDIETAVMDAYLDLAERLSSPDDLCLALLERVALELAEALSPGAQAAVLADAAGRLPDDLPTDCAPVDAACTLLESVGLVGSYRRSPWAVDADAGTCSVTVRLSEYALTPCGGRLPTLPLLLALYRNDGGRRPTAVRVGETADGWEVALTLGGGAPVGGVASAPIQPEVA